MISARKTGGGSPEANLSEMELKIKCIKGKELFEGVSSGIDLSLESPISPLSESDMSISNATNIEFKPPKKRIFIAENDTLGHSLKNTLMQGEQEKLVLLKSIDSKMDRIVNLLEAVVENQNKMICNSIPPSQPTIRLSKLLLPHPFFHLLILTVYINHLCLLSLIISLIMINYY